MLEYKHVVDNCLAKVQVMVFAADSTKYLVN